MPHDPSLASKLLGSVNVASPEESAAEYSGGSRDGRWMEFRQKIPYEKPSVYVNRSKYEEALGRPVTDEQMKKYVLADSFHNLKNVEPDTYNKLKAEAFEDPDYMKWAWRQYGHHISPVDERGVPKHADDIEERSFLRWHDESQFDQNIGGYVFGGDPDFPSMEKWSTNDPGFGKGKFKQELSKLKARVLPKPGVIHPGAQRETHEFY